MRSVFTLLGLIVSVGAYCQSDSVTIKYSATHKIKDKLTIKRLSLSEVVVKKESIPGDIKKFKNLEYLSLRPMAIGFGKPRKGPCIIRYAQAKTTSLPSWLGDLNNLQELDLIGINKIDYSTVAKSLLSLDKLSRLSIDPDTFDEILANELTNLKGLKSLKIRANVTDDQLSILKSGLPDCEIVTGLYADY